MSNEIADGFYKAIATGPGTWTKTSFGMKLEIPVTINGADYTAQSIIGDDPGKAAKARAALEANGWTKQASWPPAGAELRVNAKNKDGYVNVYVCKPGGGGGEPVPVSDVEKFLANERGESAPDPFG